MKSWNEIRKAATAFSKRWKNAYDEKSQAQSFLKEFFAVFGVDAVTVATFEHRVKFADGSQGYADCFWQGKILVEMKSRGKNLDAAFQQAMDYVRSLPDVSQTPRAIVVSDFARVRFYDLSRDCALTEFALKDLRKYVTLFGYMIGAEEGGEIREQDPVNRKAAEKMARLHDAMKAVGYTGHPLEVYLVRLLFCLFAEDTGIFKPEQLSHFIKCDSSPDGHDLAEKLASLFQTLNTAPERRLSILDDSLAAFPYVNGGLFAESLPMAAFSAEMRKALLDCGALDWSKISPAIFGAMFQGVMDEKARHDLGAHYTSEENILKLIRPLFLDALREEFEAIVGRTKDERQKTKDLGQGTRETSFVFRPLSSVQRHKLFAFHEKIASLTFLDPACGCGNFLLIAYRELRRLEMDVLEELHRDDPGQFLDISQLCKVSVSQFHGIEIEQFPAEIAKVALWLMDHLCNMEVADRFGQYFARIPIKDSPHIVCANALTTEWPRTDYTLGNPPFNGARTMTKDAKRDLEAVFKGVKGSGNLDFVTAWFKKASETDSLCAFVATNSVSQGEQVPILWKNINVEIDFAYRTFKWHNEAKGVAGVSCVIIGFHARSGNVANVRMLPTANPNSRLGTGNIGTGNTSTLAKLTKTIYIPDIKDNTKPPEVKIATHISGYLIDGPDTYMESRSTSLDPLPEIGIGNKPIDGGNYLFTPQERADFLAREPAAEEFFRLWFGADEFIKRRERWCLFLRDASPVQLSKLPLCRERIEAVRQFRLASTREATLKIARVPTRFFIENLPERDFILIPCHSSENREYIPMGFMPPTVLASNACLIVRDATHYHLGILMSRMHNAFVRTVCGRLESRYRYSKDIVYNNFPWPTGGGPSSATVTDAQERVPPEVREKIAAAAKEVLDVRKLFMDADPECSLGILYMPDTMPPDLLFAHAHLDALVDKAYGLSPSCTDADRVAHLFKLYAEKVKGTK